MWPIPKNDGFVKSRESTRNVIPVKAGIQKYQTVTKALDPGFRRGDDFLRVRQKCFPEKVPEAVRSGKPFAAVHPKNLKPVGN
jgi:hypothetical protein